MANTMKQKLAAGELVLCMNLRLARTVDIAMVAKAGGYDALYVDMEHSPYSIDTAATICAAAIGVGITPLVRVRAPAAPCRGGGLAGARNGDSARPVKNGGEAEAVGGNAEFPRLGRARGRGSG